MRQIFFILTARMANVRKTPANKHNDNIRQSAFLMKDSFSSILLFIKEKCVSFLDPRQCMEPLNLHLTSLIAL